MNLDFDVTLKKSDEPSVTETPAVAIVPNGTTNLPVLGDVIGFLEKRKDAARERIRETNAVPTNKDEEAVENAEVLREVLLELDSINSGIEATQLAALWNLHASKLYQRIGGAESLVHMIQQNKHLFHSPDAIIRKARGVETILEYVFQREQAGKTILNEDTGEILNVQHFVSQPGFVGKIAQLHSHFDKLETDADKEEMVLAIATLSKKELIDAFVSKKESEDIGVYIKAKEKFDPKSNKHVVTIEMDEREWSLFQRVNKYIVEFS